MFVLVLYVILVFAASFAQEDPDVISTNSIIPSTIEMTFGDWLLIISVVVGLITPWLYELRQRKKILSSAYQTLQWELRDIKEAVAKGSNYKKVWYHTLKGREEVDYTNAVLHDDAFSALINSGTFMQLSSQTQYDLAALYGRVRLHNETLKVIYQIRDDIMNSEVGTDDSKKARLTQLRQPYDKALTSWEKEIMMLSDKVSHEVSP
jgi:hypothetical protein